jgi:hypothetical protein
MTRTSLLSILLLASALVFAQDTLPIHYSRTITAKELSEYVYRLASKEYEGRYTGSKGQIKAGEFIRGEFEKDGLRPPLIAGKPDYIQNYTLDNCRWKDQRLNVNDEELKVGRDFLFLGDPVNINGVYPVVFAGFGIDDEKYSDFGNIDVKGKIMLVFSGEPTNKDGISVISGNKEASKKAYYFSKSAVAVDKGAAGVIIIASKDSDFKSYLKNQAYYNEEPEISYPSTGGEKEKTYRMAFSAFMDLNTASKLVQEEPQKLKEALDEMESLHTTTAGRFSGSVEIYASSDCLAVHAGNVIGMIEGTDKKSEAVVVVAHYDHLGVKKGKIFYGADDNASGTAAVMELAEAFALAAKNGYHPRRTVIFIAFSGEEEGLFGSRYYSEHPVISLDSTFACVNIDMIGRSDTKQKDKENYISGYAYLSEDILDISKKSSSLIAPGLEDKMEFRNRLRGGSDHYYFSEHGIPSLFYFEGMHKDYHQPTDTPDKILYDRMEKIVRVIFATTWELANREEKLEIRK